MAPINSILIILSVGLVAALVPAPHRVGEESLRSALNAVTRKQRSLNANPQDYYSDDIPTLMFRDAAAESSDDIGNGKQLIRQQVGRDVSVNDEDGLAFIPSGAGQVETIGDGYQHLNNKQHLDRALLADYLDYGAESGVAGASGSSGTSVFRERERTGSRKRTSSSSSSSVASAMNDQQQQPEQQLSDKELLRLLLLDLENDERLSDAAADDEQRMRYAYNYGPLEPQDIAAEIAYGYGGTETDAEQQYRQLQLLSRILEREQEMQDDRLLTAERRNVNARYPLLFNSRDKESYMAKRFPVSKRSAKPMAVKKRQVTDPKVAQDLNALFGGEKVNHSHEHDHDHDHHDHEHDHASKSAKMAGTTELVPNNINNNNNNNNNGTERSIQVRKKSVDWSQYFGIDRRKKKTVYAAKPGTQDQDNEYLLQKYYEIMAENLKPNGKNAGEKRGDQIQQMDSQLRDMKNMMIEEAVQVSSRNDVDNQQIKDEIMSRLATAYSLEKLRRALNELSSSSSGASNQQQQQRPSANAGKAANNSATHSQGNSRSSGDKRNHQRNEIPQESFQGVKNCPQMMLVEARCRASESFIQDFPEALHLPCVMYHICSSCGENDCLARYVLEAEKFCQEEEEEDEEEELQLKDLPSRSRKRCIENSLLVTRPRLDGSTVASVCHAFQTNRRCLAVYQKYYAHPYLYLGPYATFSRSRRAATGSGR